MSDLLQKFGVKELREFQQESIDNLLEGKDVYLSDTSDTKEFHFHKRDFDWLIRNFEYSWTRMFTSDLTHGWWRERNVSESNVGYRRWYMYECSLSWLGTDASIKADEVKLVYGVKPPLLVKWCGHLIMFFLNV